MAGAEGAPGGAADGAAADGAAVDGAAAVPPAAAPDVVYEQQRWYGVAGWQPPLSLDAPGWADAGGAAVPAPDPPPGRPGGGAGAGGGWSLVTGDATDADGWLYGTAFSHLPAKRPGGRASRRLNDTCRRRAWRRAGAGAAAAAAAARAPPAAAANDLPGAAAARGKTRAVRAFVAMVLDLLARRSVLDLVPWDPSALLHLYRAHAEAYAALAAAAAGAGGRRLFARGAPPAPPLLGGGGAAEPAGAGGGGAGRGGGAAGAAPPRTLLDDLLTASRHARAAYGYAMHAGHVGSVGAFVRMATVQPLAFDVVAGASAEANTEAVAAMTGAASAADVLAADWRGGAYRPVHYVALDRRARCVVVAVRGSLQEGELLTNATAHPMEVAVCGVDGAVHEGMLSAATYVHAATAAALEEAARRAPGWPVLLAGHSMGGGVAALLAMLMRQRAAAEGWGAGGGGGVLPGLGPLHCVALGPAAVASAPLAAACEGYVTSVVLGADVVPRLSEASLEALLVELSAASPVRRAAASLGRRLAATLGGGGGGGGSSGAAAGGGWAALKEASLRLAGAGPGLGRAVALGAPRAGAGGAAPVVPVIDLNSDEPPDAQLRRQREGTPEKGAAQRPQQPASPAQAPSPRLMYFNGELDAGLLGTAAAAAGAAAAGAPPAGAAATGAGAPEPLFPPGRIIWALVPPKGEDLTSLAAAEAGGEGGGAAAEAELAAAGGGGSSSGGGSSGGGAGALAGGTLVVDAERGAFSRILLLPDALDDHLPDAYVAALEALAAGA